MVLLYLVPLVLLLWGASYSGRQIYPDYMGRAQTHAVNGFFICCVFLRHIKTGYLSKAGYDFAGFGDSLFLLVDNLLGQLIVACFLFYSGYGVATQYLIRGGYAKTMPKSRIGATVLNFDVAVLLFLALDWCLGIQYDMSTVALSFIAVTSVGNSNWYILVIVLLYFAAFLAFSFGRSRNGVLGLLISLSVLLWFLLSQFSKYAWWFDTLLCFPAGAVFAFHKARIEEAVSAHWFRSLALCLACFCLLYASIALGINYRGIVHNLASVAFAFSVVVVTMRFRLGNRVICWLGENLFPLYIYQRIPMILFANVLGSSFLSLHPYLYVVVCVVVTLLISLYLWPRIRVRV